jgi:hypothetical protein
MGYAERAAMKVDPDFRGRLDACTLNEAAGKPAGDSFAEAILTRPNYGLEAFMPWVMSAPGFDVDPATITDGMLLSAVQASWDRVAALSGGTPT